jgi:hypothetical protein
LAASTPKGYEGGLSVLIRAGFQESALILARRVAELAADPAFSPETQEIGAYQQPRAEPGGAASFLAAHAFLLWGEADDRTALANLLDEPYQQRTIFGEGKYGAVFYEVREMAAMALAAIDGKPPETFALQKSKRKARCPIAAAVEMFERDGRRWEEMVNEVLGSVEERDDPPQP